MCSREAVIIACSERGGPRQRRALRPQAGRVVKPQVTRHHTTHTRGGGGTMGTKLPKVWRARCVGRESRRHGSALRVALHTKTRLLRRRRTRVATAPPLPISSRLLLPPPPHGSSWDPPLRVSWGGYDGGRWLRRASAAGPCPSLARAAPLPAPCAHGRAPPSRQPSQTPAGGRAACRRAWAPASWCSA